jgi:shikimate kinase
LNGFFCVIALLLFGARILSHAFSSRFNYIIHSFIHMILNIIQYNTGMGTYNFLDTDQIIESATSLKITQIFESEGEEAFRTIEAQILDSVHAYVRCVVSTGGGIVTRMQNWSKLQTGIVIWLDVEPSVIFKRIQLQGTDRPLLQTEDPLQTLEDLLEVRREKYEQGDLRVVVTEEMDEEMVADEVIKMMHDFIDDNPPAWRTAKAKAQAEGLDWVQ